MCMQGRQQHVSSPPRLARSAALSSCSCRPCWSRCTCWTRWATSPPCPAPSSRPALPSWWQVGLGLQGDCTYGASLHASLARRMIMWPLPPAHPPHPTPPNFATCPPGAGGVLQRTGEADTFLVVKQAQPPVDDQEITMRIGSLAVGERQ